MHELWCGDLAAIQDHPCVIFGSLRVREIVAGASGGKTEASKVIVSPFCASSSAWRRVPAPLFSMLVTTKVFPDPRATTGRIHRVISRTKVIAEFTMIMYVLLIVLSSRKSESIVG